MANNQSQFKVNQLAKDLGIKGKEIVELLSEKGFEVKSQSSLEPVEFGVFLDTLTKANQIEKIDDYIDGITAISSKKPVEKAEIKTAPSDSAKEKAEERLQEKTEKDNKATVAKKDENTKEAAPKKNTEGSEKPEKSKTAAAPAKKADPDTNTVKEKQSNTVKPEASEEKSRENPAEKGTFEARSQRPAPSKAQQSYNANAARQETYNGSHNSANQSARSGSGSSFGSSGEYNNSHRGGFSSQGGNGGFSSSRQGGFNSSSNRSGFGDKKPAGNKQGYGGNGYNRSGKSLDDDYIPSAPKPKFQPQAIVRGQTPKGSVARKTGATRVIDTHTTTVDLSKYDEKLDSFVPESQNIRADKQKLKKQNNRDPYKKDRGEFIKQKQPAPVKKKPIEITVPDEITVGEFASRMKIAAGEVIKKLMLNGIMATVNQTIDYDTAFLIADELGAIVTKEVVVTIEEKLFDETEDNEADLVERAPVVCVMGHVDHGKTSILDAIRHTSVTAGEAGGITQHIGAYRVNINGKPITFLDTPGHEAFTAMRARGAMATDIAILVVAADDGIMPQTIEAINHAKAAGIEIIVAINKMDKPTANPDAVKQALTQYSLVPEEWGGDVMCVPVSAVTKEGIQDLLEDVLLVAEVKELKANPARRAKGIVIEAKLDKGRGPVATVLVQNGTLHSGDIVIAGTAVGHVRMMTDHNGKMLKEAGPSVPAEIIGLSEVPSSGDEFQVVEDERMARTLADKRKNAAKEEMFKANARANLNDLFAQISEGIKTLNIIVKADVGGSVEAVKSSLEKITNEEVKVSVIHAATGGITEGDVMLAAASNAIIVGFNVRPDKAALDSAERQNVDIRTYRIIYECIDEITAAMKGMLAPKFKETLLGHAEVRQTIHVPGVGTIAGSYVQDGKITRTSQIRVLRDGVVIFEDKVSSLKRFKDDAREVASGYECGIGLDRFNDIKLGDILEAYIMEEIERD